MIDTIKAKYRTLPKWFRFAIYCAHSVILVPIGMVLAMAALPLLVVISLAGEIWEDFE